MEAVYGKWTREHHSRIANVLRPAHPDQNYSQKCIPPSCPPPTPCKSQLPAPHVQPSLTAADKPNIWLVPQQGDTEEHWGSVIFPKYKADYVTLRSLSPH